MRIITGFFLGVIFWGFLFLGIQMPASLIAQAGNSDVFSDNFSLEQLLPDLEHIYRAALTTPLQEAEKKIYDEDIAHFYHSLLVKTGLNEGQ